MGEGDMEGKGGGGKRRRVKWAFLNIFEFNNGKGVILRIC